MKNFSLAGLLQLKQDFHSANNKVFCHNDSMHPRQVPQYIGRKLGEFYGLLRARRRSIVLSLEEDLNTTLRRSKNWIWEKHFFVV